MNMTCEFSVHKNAPCLNGHFPGNPIVPGAYILNQISVLCEEKTGGILSSISKVKFIQPLKPEEKATLTLIRKENQQTVSFSLCVSDRTILSGKGKLTP